MNDTNNIKITVLSPVHIGGAQEKHYQNGLDVFWENGTLYYLPLESLSGHLDETLIQFFANGDKAAILNRLKQKGFNFEKSSIKKWNCPFKPEQDEIKSLIKTGFGKPVLPGSSLKGSVRSHLFKTLSKGHNKVTEIVRSLKNGERFNKNIEGFVLDQFNPQAKNSLELLRFFQFSDFQFEESEILPVKVFNLIKDEGEWYGAWKSAVGSGNNDWDFTPSGFVTHYEVLKEGLSAKGRINILGNVHQNYLSGIPEQFFQLGMGKGYELEVLFSIINQNMQSYLAKEIEFFNTNYDNDEVAESQIAPFYEKLISELSQMKNACLLRVGGGSGFHSMTGDWLYDDHLTSVENPYQEFQRGRIKNLTKSRKLTFKKSNNDFEFRPMGWIKIERT